jgi:hypothetical protein
MDHQGPGRGRSAADTRGQAAWSWLEDGAEPEDRPDQTPGGTQPVLRRGTGNQPVLGSGSGNQPVLGSGSGAQPVLGYGSGAQQVLDPGTGPQRMIGTGAQPVTGTGAQPAPGGVGLPGPYDRTPPQGFAPGRGPSGATQSGSGSWSTVTGPIPGVEPATDGGYGAFGPAEENNQADDATNPFARLETPAPAAAAVPARRRRSGKTDSGKTDSAKAAGRPGSRSSRLGSRSALLAVASVVVLAGVGFGGYKYLYEARVNAPVSPTLRLPTSAPGSPGSPGFDKSLGKWQHIGSRTTDPDALTIEGLYPPQFVLNGSSYVRTAATVTKNCPAAVYGANLQAALQSGHCSQVARASYVSGNNLMMGTVGVINLNTSAAATKAGQATGPQEIIIPLAAKKGITKKLGNGTGVVQAEVKGHYLILMWAEFTSLKSPSTSAAKTELEQFATSLVTGTANINLSTRMLSGKS